MSDEEKTLYDRLGGMRISEGDWNVFLGHAGATLAKFKVPEAEQREVVALVQSLKKDVVE